MTRSRLRWMAPWLFLAVYVRSPIRLQAAEPPSSAETAPAWLGEELPLPLSVKTPQDLALKAVAERQYLVFNLLARGKLAWDAGDFATAASKWDALLRIPGLDPDLERVVKPLAVEARDRAAQPASGAGGGPSSPAGSARPAVTISGQISGGDPTGAGGAIVWLKRSQGGTPRPAPLRGRSISQVNKAFVPRVLPVTVGTTVEFNNHDPIFHNVFSLSRPNDFDSGLHRAGQSFSRTFDKPGPVQLQCNIHAAMSGYIVVLDSPWYTQADSAGAFNMRGIPPGDYDLEAWHESSARTVRQKITVGSEGLRGVQVRLAGEPAATSAGSDKVARPGQGPLDYLPPTLPAGMPLQP